MRCCSLQSVECISRRSCPGLGLSDDRGAEIARRDNLTHWLISTQVADAFSVVVHVVTSTDENWHLVYAPRALTARACFLSYVPPVHYNVVTDEARGADDPLSPVL